MNDHATEPAAATAAPHEADPRGAFRRAALLIAGVNSVLVLTTALTAEKLGFLYKDVLGLDAGGVAGLGVWLLLPSYLRPLFGWLADARPLWGSHRRAYFLLAAGCQITGYLSLALMPRYTLGPVAAGVLLALSGVYLRLVIIEAVSVRVGNATGQVARLQTVQWLVPSAGMVLFGAHLSGWVTQHWTYSLCFRAAALCALLPLPLVLLIDERRAGDGAWTAHADRARTREAMGRGLRAPGLWPVVAFAFLLQLAPRAGTAQFFFQVDHLHFSKQLIGDLGGYGSAGEIMGIVLFGLLAPRLPARAIVLGAVALAVPLYVPLFWLQGPASARVVGVVSSAAAVLILCAITTLAARACPPRIEATVFGLVMAAMTLGGALSNKLGSALYVWGSAGGHPVAGWHTLLWAGLASACLPLVLWPRLPVWARSAEPLRASGG